MLVRLLVTIALAGVLGPGCDAPAPASDQSPAPSAAAATPVAPAESEAQVPVAALAIALPAVSKASEGPEPAHAFTIQATPDAMVFDNEAAVSALLADQAPAALSLVRALASELEGDVKADLLTRGEVDRTKRRGHLIVQLYDLIAAAVDHAKLQGALLERPPQTTTALALDKGLNMGRVLDVLYTAGKGEVQDFVAIAEGPVGRRAIPFSLPRPCTPAEQDGRCWSPAAFLDTHGVYIGLTRGGSPGCIPAPSAARHDARGYLFAGFGGECPSVSHRALDMAGIDTVLWALKREDIALCPNIQLGAEPGAQWGQLVGVIAQLGSHFGVVVTDRPPIHKKCAEAVPIVGIAAAIAAEGPALEGRSDEEVWGGSATEPVPVPASAAVQPKIELKRVVTSGGFSRDDVQMNTKAHGGEIRYCYRETLGRSPAIAGEIGFRVTIGTDGKVKAIEQGRDTLKDEQLRLCIEKSFRRWTYLSSKAPTTPTIATVTWTLAPG
ncbi:MAG: AgmX/PglI C-terminal domain-containing protein [Nannocystis sp.]|nr:AgmX/PglI C-terminal domain-containing protein [Nannocystis sp.]MBA3545802.1 AgmX/PglI C-terminal domain-containing protein [Nannocystis sp.]